MSAVTSRMLPAAVLGMLASGCGRLWFDADAPADAPADDTAGVDATVAPASCGQTLVFADSFEDGAVTPPFMTYLETGMSLVEESGHLDVVYAATVNDAWSSYLTTTAYPREGLCTLFEVASIPANGGELFVRHRGFNNEWNTVFTRTGEIVFDASDGTNTRPGANVPLDLGVHRFWRLRHAAGVTAWDTSSDGITFYQRGEVMSFGTGTARIEMGAGSDVSVMNGGFARFESVTTWSP